METPHITRSDFLTLSGHTRDYYDHLMRNEEVSLAFGSPIPALHGHYIVLDAVAMRLAAELAQLLVRREAAQIILSHWSVWLDGIGRDEWDAPTIYFGVGVLPTGDGKRDFLVDSGTPEQLRATFERNHFTGAKLVLVNLRRMLDLMRIEAEDAGIPFPDPLLPRPDSPEYLQLIQDGEAHRLQAMKRMAERARKRAGREHRVQ